MPIPFPGPYDTLCSSASKGHAVPFGGPCDGCGRKGSYFFTGKSVTRGAVLSDKGGPQFRQLAIPLARCAGCGRWARVLPLELLPRKIYELAVIQRGMSYYVFGTASLRATEKAVAGPHYSTLHH